MKFTLNQSVYRGNLVSWNETDGYFCAIFNDAFYKKGVGFKKFKTAEDAKKKIDDMLTKEEQPKKAEIQAPEKEKKTTKKKK